MRKYLFALSLISAPVCAELVESIEKFTDIFGVSASSVDNETVFTLDANYYLTDNLRAFGDIDTESNWEVGLGYSFISGESYYTENSIKVSEDRFSTGIFAAKSLNERWVLLGDVNYNYLRDREHRMCDVLGPCDEHSLDIKFQASNTIDYSAGFLWSPFKFADFLYKFNHEVGVDKNVLRLGQSDFPQRRTDIQYHEIALLMSIKFLQPTITYTIREESDNYLEFGLSFNF